MSYAKVPNKLTEFCQSINTRRKHIDRNDIIEAYNLSFDAHFQLVTIHPWADGNGRMSRLLMNQLQFEFEIIPTKIDKQSKQKYIDTLIATRETDSLQLFRNFMFDEHIHNLEQIISTYKTSTNNDDIPVNVPVKISERERKIISMMREDASISARELAEIFAVAEKTIKRDIASLKEKGLVVRIGSDKSGKWKAID